VDEAELIVSGGAKKELSAAGRLSCDAACVQSILVPSESMKEIIRSSTILRRLYYRARLFRGARGQSDEARIISDLVKGTGAPKTFIEFGFHPIEFNCASLAQDRDWQGLLIDGSARQVSDARSVIPNRIDIVEAFLTLHNLDFIKSRFPKLGVLSIDVDGNDDWFLEKLIDIKPSGDLRRIQCELWT
jgi:hypothetical protein